MRASIVVHTRPSCLFCRQVIDLLTQSGIPFAQREITDRKEQDRLIAEYHARSFPIVTADGQYVGGYAQIVQLHATGRLGQLLADSSSADGIPRAETSSQSLPPQSLPPSQISGPSRPASSVGNMARLFKAMKGEPGKE